MARMSFAPRASVAVIGLGRFGGAVAQALANLGHEVLGIDSDAAIVQSWSDRLAHVVQADCTSELTQRELGLHDMDHVVIGIGSDLESSILATMALADIGVKDIWAKALGPRHGRMLERMGAHHVIYPELAMGERVAHIISDRVMDFIEFPDGFAVAQVSAPELVWGKTLAEAALRSRFAVTVVGVKRAGADFEYAKPETVVDQANTLIVAGKTDAIQRFAAKCSGG